MEVSALCDLAGTVWLNRHKYIKAETFLASPAAQVPAVSSPYAELLGELSAMRVEIEQSLKGQDAAGVGSIMDTLQQLQLGYNELKKMFDSVMSRVEFLEKQVSSIVQPAGRSATQQPAKKTDDEDIDLFGSDDDPVDEEKEKIRQQRLQAYEAKKSKKPAAVAKSSVVLDVKPWDDETDMKEMEARVRSVAMDGLVWGASKLVPVGYGIKKLQIMCVVEDDKVSVEALTEQIEGYEAFVQSVDIVAFNKI